MGVALQAGVDYRVSDNLLVNLGIWWADIDTDAEFEFAGNRLTTDVEIDPLVYMFSVGWKF